MTNEERIASTICKDCGHFKQRHGSKSGCRVQKDLMHCICEGYKPILQLANTKIDMELICCKNEEEHKKHIANTICNCGCEYCLGQNCILCSRCEFDYHKPNTIQERLDASSPEMVEVHKRHLANSNRINPSHHTFHFKKLKSLAGTWIYSIDGKHLQPEQFEDFKKFGFTLIEYGENKNCS